ncbi:MFS transporter [Desulfofundulus salinus]|uniref:MFS transporter n=1 Tax=Desulfofundulus salinus TaxID=2419843 RepID=UPI001FAB21FB|nr:MFS transporter [Desulfofundulus salinum]
MSMLFALVLGLLTLYNVVQYWHMAVLAFLLGTMHALDMPARQAFIVELVGRDDLMNALRGRAMSVYSLVFIGLVPVGNFFSGTVVHLWGAPAGFALGGGLALLFLLFLSRRLLRHQHTPVS